MKTNRILGYLPSSGGMVLIVLGLLLMGGGGIGVKTTPESEPIWVLLPMLDAWVCWLLIWFGIDQMIFKGKATTFVMNKTVVPIFEPILEGVIGKDRLEKLNRKLGKQGED